MISFEYFKRLTAAACATVACSAQAQGNVTVYGLLDLALVKQSGGRATSVDRGSNNRIGFRGTEDLGDGLRATFHLQHRFRPDTGAVERAPVFWQGESTVGLARDGWGSLRLGRATTAMWQKNWAFEPWGASGFNASLGAFQLGNYTFSSDGTNDAAMGSANFARSPNAVFYNSPNFAGFSVAVSGQVEKDAGAKSRNTSVSFNYDQGPLSVMLSGEQNTDEDVMGFVAASYAIGPLKLMGSYAHIEHDGAGDESSYVVAATYNLATGTVRGGYGRDSDVGAWKTSFGYVHPLSKRTSLYADLWRQKSATSDAFNGLALGMSHSF
ncbi:porin [Piscinibacter sp.]|uniref:porin n=1 Tax=Piscinibacter sp. TaxID=1903157 RepID=UPI002C98F8A7|nr:porin [Albitalea sp.]HUG24388.1 porin [Albitalea sp.]